MFCACSVSIVWFTVTNMDLTLARFASLFFGGFAYIGCKSLSRFIMAFPKANDFSWNGFSSNLSRFLFTGTASAVLAWMNCNGIVAFVSNVWIDCAGTGTELVAAAITVALRINWFAKVDFLDRLPFGRRRRDPAARFALKHNNNLTQKWHVFDQHIATNKHKKCIWINKNNNKNFVQINKMMSKMLGATTKTNKQNVANALHLRTDNRPCHREDSLVYY